MKRILVTVGMVAIFALAAIVAQAQTCPTPVAQMIHPTNGETLQPDSAGNITFAWCNASADYFVTIETVPGAHDIFFAFTGGTGGGAGQNFLTLPAVNLPSSLCFPTPPIGCIPEAGEHIFFTLDTVQKKTLIGSNQYTFTAPSPAAFSPTSLNLGGILLGKTGAAKQVTFTNTSTGSFTISSVRASGNFSETDTCTGVTLAPSGTCTISVKFTPTVTGTIPGALTITDNLTTSPQVMALTGRGMAPLSVSPTSLSFGTVNVGASSAPQTITLTNNTSGSLGFTFLASSNYNAVSGTCTGTLLSKAKCTVNVTFSPTANGAANGSLAISSVSFPTQLASFSGTGSGGATSPLTFSPLSGGFSSTLVGTASAGKTVKVTNPSTTSTVNITNFVASGDYSVVGGATTPCGGTLGPLASCKVSVTFSPSMPGSIKGSVTFMDNAAVNTQLYNLTGKGVLPVSFSLTSLTFAGQTVGTTSSPQTVTLTNNQAIALNISSIVASGQYTASAGGSTPCGSTVGPKSSCTFVVTFSPKQQATIPGVVTVTHDASGNPQVVKLTGTGQ